MRDVLAALAGWAGVAIAWWLLPASIHIVDWRASGPARVALLAPLLRLWIALGIAAAGAILTLVVGVRDTSTRTLRARMAAPLALFWLWTLPYWPWLPDRAPLLLVLAGPVRWTIAAAAVIGVFCAWPSGPRWERLDSWRIGRAAIFLCTFAIYAWLGVKSQTTIGFFGDEPHYLTITHSLFADRDLKIENNHAREDYRAFFQGALRPDYLRRGTNGEIYSIHAPGLPALLLPGYALAGARGALLTMCLFGALAALAVFDVAAILGGPLVALLTWASVCLTVPWMPHSWSVYPEIAAAAIVAWAAAWLIQPAPDRAVTWIWRGACLAILPWLHTKFIVFVAALVPFLLVRIIADRARLVPRRFQLGAMFVAPLVVSLAAWLGFFYVIYGSINPEAPYGTLAERAVDLQNIPRSMLGLFFDQKFGLLVYSPLYVLAAVGAWPLMRDGSSRIWATVLVITSALFMASTGRMYMWWGGSSAPARFLVPVLPLWAPFIAAAIARARHPALRAAIGASIAFSLLVAGTAVLMPDRQLLFSVPHGVARMLDVVQGSAPLTAAWPTFTDENWRAPAVRMAPWLAAAAIGLAVGFVVSRGRRAGVFWIAVLEAGVFFTAGAFLSGPFSAAVRAESSGRGAIGVLDAYEPARLRGFDYETWSKIDANRLLAAGTARFPLRAAPMPSSIGLATEPIDESGRLAGPLSLPPGRFQVRVWFEGERARPGDAIVSLGTDVILSRASGPLSNPAVVAFDLPFRVPLLWVAVTDLAAARSASLVEIVPMAVVPASARHDTLPQVVEPLPGRDSAFLSYEDENSYPEGGVFWTRGTAAAEVRIATAGASHVDLVLHVGPNDGVVALNIAGRNEDAPMKPNETTRVSFDVPPGTSVVPLRVQAARAFRPIDTEPGSTDTRTLGCQVRIEVR